MTTPLSAPEVSSKLGERLPEAIVSTTDTAILVEGKSLLDVAGLLKDTPGLDFDYLTTITGVDYYQYFEVVYLFVSMVHNHSLVLKARCPREDPRLPSLAGLWRSADHQEREIFDLLGVTFEGHPNLKRIVLWPEFEGYPLRKDFL
jgi:NADH-quinone oxidoreductase subunit C